MVGPRSLLPLAELCLDALAGFRCQTAWNGAQPLTSGEGSACPSMSIPSPSADISCGKTLERRAARNGERCRETHTLLLLRN